MSTDETEVKEVRDLVRKLMGGFQLIFVSLTIGIIAENSLNWVWVRTIINWSIFIFTVILIVLKNKMDKKASAKDRELLRNSQLSLSENESEERGKTRGEK